MGDVGDRERPKGMGFFERLATRLVGGPAGKVQAAGGEGKGHGFSNPASGARARSAEEPSPERRMWADALALPAKIASEPAGWAGDDLGILSRASAAWAKAAREEIQALREAAARAEAAGWAPAKGLAGSLEKAADVLAGGLLRAETPAKIFACGWEAEDRPALWRELGQGPEAKRPRRWRMCGLVECGSEAPERLAALAAAARCARRMCEMSMGERPAFSKNGIGEADFSEKHGFLSGSGVWAARRPGQSAMAAGTSYGAAERGVPHEPSLGLMCKAFGDLPILALRRGAPDLASEASLEYAKSWSKNAAGFGAGRGSGLWVIPSKPTSLGLGLGLGEEGSAIARQVFELAQSVRANEAKAALACGVPAWSLGLGEVPSERWMAEPISDRIAKAPDGYWGEGAEHERLAWSQACEKERLGIREAERSAAFSDDPRCRASESADCSRRSSVVDAQEALVDWAWRARLPSGSPWAATPDCAKAAAEALLRAEKSDGRNPVGSARGVEGFMGLAARAGLDASLGLGALAGSSAADIAGTLSSWAEARQIDAACGRAPSGSASAMRL